MKRPAVGVVIGGAGLVLAAWAADVVGQRTTPPGQGLDRPVVVASKPFPESYLLAEMFAQLLEDRGIVVDRRPGLGATELAIQALRNGAIDVYPEYTGTGLLAILGETPADTATSADVYRYVARTFHDRWGLHWLPPLGFENSYAITVRRETAERYGLETLSDLAEVSSPMTAGFTPDFIGREDGLPGLREAYGIGFRQVRSLLQSVKYEALATGRVDVIDGYTTDGSIARYDMVVLEDDRDFFPPYDAAPLAGAALPERNPRALVVLTRTAGRFDAELMRELNRRLEVERHPLQHVARVGLARAGLLPPGDTLWSERMAAAGAEEPAAGDPPDAIAPEPVGVGEYMWERRASLGQMTLRHLLLAGLSLLAAVLVAVPLGLLLERVRGGAEPTIRGVGLLQTIPSIALLALMIPLLGIGVVPALVALFLYALFPILRNTYTGVRDADPVAVDAARSLGMTPGQVLRQVRLPLAAPVIMAGVRTAAVISVGTATLAAFIGAGGLGDPIVSGLALSDDRMILSGALPAAALAFVVDGLLALVERWTTPPGVRVGEGAR